MNILELQHVSITYQGEKQAVNSVSFSVPKNSIVAVVGESGSGKSTLIRAVMGLLPPGGKINDGKILFCGEDMEKFSAEKMQRIRGCDISMIFQNAGEYLNPRRTIESQYLETLRCHITASKTEQKQMALHMLANLKLSDGERIMKSYPFQLSGGMKQRVAIAMAMSLSPKLLLADEPTSALDVTIQAQVVWEMLQMRERLGTAVVIVTHNMGVASRMADYIAVMQNGKMKEFGTRDQIIEYPQNDYTKHLLSVVPDLKQ